MKHSQMMRRNALLTCLPVIACLSLATYAQPPREGDATDREPAYRTLLHEHLDEAYRHTFAAIDPGWRVEKRWLKPVPNALQVMDPEEYPIPEPDWQVSLRYFDEDQLVKSIRMTQDGAWRMERDDAPGLIVVRSWYRDGSFGEYDYRREGRRMAGIRRHLHNDAISSFQHGRGTLKRFDTEGNLQSASHIWDGRTYCFINISGPYQPGTTLHLPGITMRFHGDTEVLRLTKGHEQWERTGERIEFRHIGGYIDGRTGEYVRRPSHELSDVPTMPLRFRPIPEQQMKQQMEHIHQQWVVIYEQRRADAIAAFDAFFAEIDQKDLLDRVLNRE